MLSSDRLAGASPAFRTPPRARPISRGFFTRTANYSGSQVSRTSQEAQDRTAAKIPKKGLRKSGSLPTLPAFVRVLQPELGREQFSESPTRRSPLVSVAHTKITAAQAGLSSPSRGLVDLKCRLNEALIVGTADPSTADFGVGFDLEGGGAQLDLGAAPGSPGSPGSPTKHAGRLALCLDVYDEACRMIGPNFGEVFDHSAE